MLWWEWLIVSVAGAFAFMYVMYVTIFLLGLRVIRKFWNSL